MGIRKGMDVIWALDAIYIYIYIYIYYALIYALIYVCTYVKERKGSLKLLHQFYIWSYKHRFSADLVFWCEAYWVGGSGT